MSNIISPLRSFSDVVASSERMFSDQLLGKLFDSPSDGAIYKLVKCVNGDIAAAGECAQIDVSEGSNYEVEQAVAASVGFCGVALAAITSSSYGFLQVAGAAEICHSATLASAGKLVVVGATAGYVTNADLTTASHGARIVGLAIDDGAASATAYTVVLRPGLI